MSRRHSEPLPHLDTVFVADGGLIGGIVAWYAGTANLAGVEPDEAATRTAALTICTRHTSAYLPLPSGLKIVLHHPASAMLVWAQLEWTW